MRSNLFILPAIVALWLAQGVWAQEKIAVTTPAILDPSAPIAEGVRQSCGVDIKVGEEIFLRVSERFPGTDRTHEGSPSAAGGTVLKVTILGVLGVGGGGWSGSKAITIRADVVQNAKTIVSRTLNRTSTGGVLGPVSGTCAIMDRIAVALGRDVAAWLPVALSTARYLQPNEPVAQPPKEGAASPAAVEKPEGEPKQ